MGEFRDRMERDLEIRGFSLSTRQAYLARMKAMVADRNFKPRSTSGTYICYGNQAVRVER